MNKEYKILFATSERPAYSKFSKATHHKRVQRNKSKFQRHNS